jgi:hypothetical protein
MYARDVVIAAGAYSPQVVQRIQIDGLKDSHPTKIPVLVLRTPDAPLARAMLLSPRLRLGPNLVPFDAPNGLRGVTICLNEGDVECDARGAMDADRPVDAIDLLELQLSRWYPALGGLAARQTIHGNVYMCQKLNYGSREPLLKWVDDSAGDERRALFAFYPGKFTAAPIAAAECAHQVKALRGTAAATLPVSDVPKVAKQPYMHDDLVPEYRLDGHDGMLTIARLEDA